DCIVSPANSFGIMDGGFDLELSRIFRGPSADMYSLTEHVQAHLRVRWAGFAPPTSCTLVPLPDTVRGEGGNRWGTHALAVVPTMKRPERVDWHEDLAYTATWALLCEVARWNAENAEKDEEIGRVLMTGLGTGAGGVGVERCARQMVLAVQHYASPLPASVRW
ncbi:hypothetical protein C8Q76DRAFT_585156, partial [Earliella scabrosa]